MIELNYNESIKTKRYYVSIIYDGIVWYNRVMLDANTFQLYNEIPVLVDELKNQLGTINLTGVKVTIENA